MFYIFVFVKILLHLKWILDPVEPIGNAEPDV